MNRRGHGGVSGAAGVKPVTTEFSFFFLVLFVNLYMRIVFPLPFRESGKEGRRRGSQRKERETPM